MSHQDDEGGDDDILTTLLSHPEGSTTSESLSESSSAVLADTDICELATEFRDEDRSMELPEFSL